MDNRQRASEWVAMYADNNALARYRQAVDSLTALLDSVLREAMESSAGVCDRLAREADECHDAHAAIWAEEVARRIRALATPPADTK